jgi:CheY-like chemotaxis protein
MNETNQSQKLILAVDDSSLALQTLKSHLSGSPYKLICVTSGEDALKFIERKIPDLYILDLEMPEMDGQELAMQILEANHAKDIKTAPMIFLTGNRDTESVAKALSVGAVDFIIKPMSREKLLGRIEKYLDN